MNPPKTILILAASGDYNLGDELIVESEIRYFHTKYPRAHIQMCVYDGESQVDRPSYVDTIHYFPYQIRKHPLKNMRYFWENIYALTRAHLVVIGGGGLFFDSEPGVSFRKMLWQWWIRITLARIFGAKIVFFGISLEIKKEKNIPLLAKLFHKNDTLLPRDERSVAMLQKLGITAVAISDMVFLSQTVCKPRLGEIRRVGVSLREGFSHTDSLVGVLIEFLKTREYEIVFLSHSLHPTLTHNDREIVKELEHLLQVEVTHSLQSTLEAYRSLDAVIGMRFHSVVLSALHGIPIIPISYGPKVDALSDELELNDLLVVAELFSIEDFAKKWHYLEKHHDSLAHDISQRATHIQKKLLQQLDAHDILGI